MEDEMSGKGEKRLEPVDVDTIDNFINAQAAYLEALNVAVEHFDVTLPEEYHERLRDVLAGVAGSFLMAISGARM